jgi:hypothetical protein
MTGSGTESDPYIIKTAKHLADLGTEVDAVNSVSKTGVYYALDNDIDLAEYTEWDPIGANGKNNDTLYPNPNSGFGGVLDGRGHVISNLNVGGQVQYGGLFGSNFAGTLMNLGIESSEINTTVGSSTSASFIRKMGKGTGKLINCYSLADCHAYTRSSGLVDEHATGDFVAGCYYAGTVTSDTTTYPPAGIMNSSASTGTLAHCYCDSSKVGVAYNATSENKMNIIDCVVKPASQITADLMNGNLSTVATLAGVDVTKLCSWTTGADGLPRLVVKSA